MTEGCQQLKQKQLQCGDSQTGHGSAASTPLGTWQECQFKGPATELWKQKLWGLGHAIQDKQDRVVLLHAEVWEPPPQWPPWFHMADYAPSFTRHRAKFFLGFVTTQEKSNTVFPRVSHLLSCFPPPLPPSIFSSLPPFLLSLTYSPLIVSMSGRSQWYGTSNYHCHISPRTYSTFKK